MPIMQLQVLYVISNALYGNVRCGIRSAANKTACQMWQCLRCSVGVDIGTWSKINTASQRKPPQYRSHCYKSHIRVTHLHTLLSNFFVGVKARASSLLILEERPK